jgi:hypothetical protein
MPLQSAMPESFARASNARGVASSATMTSMACARRIGKNSTTAARGLYPQATFAPQGVSSDDLRQERHRGTLAAACCLSN